MIFELWDRQTGNRLGEFTSPPEALEVVWEILQDDGPEAVEMLAMGMVEDGHPVKLYDGKLLLQMARQSHLTAAG